MGDNHNLAAAMRNRESQDPTVQLAFTPDAAEELVDSTHADGYVVCVVKPGH